ncbi:MAG TPA: TolC family protein [Candidatus Acidoferrales bacterium]|nr:TolC family protein [Candidatus Acidoferrales bacterium]
MTVSHKWSWAIFPSDRLALAGFASWLLLVASPLAAQQFQPLVSAGPPSRSVQQATPAADAGRLTLREAIALALKNNLSVRVARTQVDEAAGTELRKRSALEPTVTSDAFANLQDRNLHAIGFTFPGAPIPLTTGTFGTYDFRVFAKQSVVDRQAYHTYQSSKRQLDATKMTYQDTRDLVIRQAAGYYLDAQAASAELQAAGARVETSRALEKLARDQHAAGLATAVDVLRAQVQLQRDQQSLLVARDSYQTSLLVLQRYLGLRPGAPLELAERLEFRTLAPPEPDQAVQAALEARADFRALRAQREALGEQLKASHARYYPKLSINGDYGAFGRNFGEMPGVGQVQGTVSFTLFDRDRSGEKQELSSRLERVEEQIADLQRGIEQDVRKALLDLASAEQQVSVTQAGVDLAASELKLAEDRFRNGVTDNIEVITAQSSLQSAQDDHIAALARHADARMALARALGATEQSYERYLGEK